MPSRTWADLDAQVQRALEKLQSQTERRILREYAAALKKIRNDMGKLYEKLAAPDGTLSLAEMTKYNRFNTLEKQIAGIMKESNGIVVSELARLAPEMYNESYFRYAWAFDQKTGVALSWGPVQRDALLAVSTNQMDKIAIEIGGGKYANKLYKEVSLKHMFPFHYGIVNIFDNSKEARKYARENYGCRISLHNALLSNLLTEIRSRADRLNERNIEEAKERWKKEGV